MPSTVGEFYTDSPDYLVVVKCAFFGISFVEIVEFPFQSFFPKVCLTMSRLLNARKE